MWTQASKDYPESGWYLSRIEGEEKSLPMFFAANIICGVDGKTYKKEQVKWFDEKKFLDPTIYGTWYATQVMVNALTRFSKMGWITDGRRFSGNHKEVIKLIVQEATESLPENNLPHPEDFLSVFRDNRTEKFRGVYRKYTSTEGEKLIHEDRWVTDMEYDTPEIAAAAIQKEFPLTPVHVDLSNIPGKDLPFKPPLLNNQK